MIRTMKINHFSAYHVYDSVSLNVNRAFIGYIKIVLIIFGFLSLAKYTFCPR